MPAPRVSVLIPTLHAEPYLAELIPALESQEVEGGHEVRVLDSDSRDCTRQILRSRGIAVTWMPREEFAHGSARNALASEARGELFVFLSQDALPRGTDFLARLVEPFADERVGATRARILPRPADDPLTARTVLADPEASDEPSVLDGVPGASGGPGEPGRPAGELLPEVRFSNVASCLRRAAHAALPFPAVPFAEDLAWAVQALAAGWRIAFVPRAVVYHAHAYTPAQAFERYRVDAAALRRFFGHRVRPTLFSVARGIAHEVREDVRFVRARGGARHLLRSPGLRSAQILGQYFGSRGWRLSSAGGEATRSFV